MFTTLLLSCLLPALSSDVPVTDGAAAALPELVTASYDLGRVWTAPTAEQQVLRTVPFRFVYDDVRDAENDSAEFPVDALTTFVWNVVAPGEFEYEGRRLETDGPQALRVTAPASVQADVKATLDYLAAATQRRARLDIDIWRATGDGALPDPADSATLAAAEAAGTLLRLAGRHEELTLGRTERRAAFTQTRFLRDWEPEIAKSAVAAQPEFEMLRTGTLLLLRVDALQDGRVALRFVEQVSELRGMERRSDAVRATFHGDAGSSQDVVIGTLDQPAVAFATLAGSRVLAPGEEFVTVAHAQTLDGPAGFVVRYRLVSLDAEPAPLQLPGTPARVVRAVDLSAALWPALAAAEPTAGQYFSEPGSEADHTWLHFPSEERRDPAEAVERAWELLGGDDADATPWILGTTVILGGDAATVDRQRVALLGQAGGRQSLTLQIELLDSGHAPPGRAVGHAVLPLSTGDTGVVVVGCARMLLAGYDVDVAEGAAVPDPNVAGCLDGLALRARAASDGSVSLDVLSHRVLRRELLDLRVPGMMPVDRVDLAVVSLAARLLPDGTWHSQPDIAGGSDGTQLALRWRLTAP